MYFVNIFQMLNISRKVFNLRGFKCLKILPRAACSGRFSQSQTIDTLQNAGKEGNSISFIIPFKF